MAAVRVINRPMTSSVFHMIGNETIQLSDLETVLTAIGTDGGAGYSFSGNSVTATSAKFSSVLPGQYLIITSSENTGENDGSYKVASVAQDGTSLTVEGNFVTNAADTTASFSANLEPTIIGATITQVWHGSVGAGAYWSITRNSNVAGIYTQTNNIDYAGDGIAMIQDSGSSAVCALNSATDGFLMLEFQKILQATG